MFTALPGRAAGIHRAKLDADRARRLAGGGKNLKSSREKEKEKKKKKSKDKKDKLKKHKDKGR